MGKIIGRVHDGFKRKISQIKMGRRSRCGRGKIRNLFSEINI